MSEFVSRAGLKLEHALDAWNVDVRGKICADLGSNVGGFVDCLLQRGAAKVYEWKLRKDPRVAVYERTNAMHVLLPEPVDFVTIDVAWTRQRNILPSAGRLIGPGGRIITLIKPHYEADKSLLRDGVLQAAEVDGVINEVKRDMNAAGFEVLNLLKSPILGGEGNIEALAELAAANAGTFQA
jgi:23S rRNA (cytidine1920-2'-O)/16S rRNA (cytidine1409-2'-O)-methyltransferase